jgi:uncharacterized membrane protein YfcA
MTLILAQWPVWMLAAIVATTFVAGVAHGAMGFGFPLLSTPVVALYTDVRTAVLVTLLPNIVLNLISVVRGSQWRQTLRQHWPVAAYVLAGTLVGTRVLSFADPRFLRLLLASMIVVYLVQARARRGATGRGPGWRHPRLARAVCGLAGGFFSGTVNVTLPPLLMYFSTLGLAPLAMTQALNLSFLVGRVTQAVAVGAAGEWSPALLALSVPLSASAVFALTLGYRLQKRIAPNTFLRLLHAILWTMAAVLVFQALRGWVAAPAASA